MDVIDASVLSALVTFYQREVQEFRDDIAIATRFRRRRVYDYSFKKKVANHKRKMREIQSAIHKTMDRIVGKIEPSGLDYQ